MIDKTKIGLVENHLFIIIIVVVIVLMIIVPQVVINPSQTDIVRP